LEIPGSAVGDLTCLDNVRVGNCLVKERGELTCFALLERLASSEKERLIIEIGFNHQIIPRFNELKEQSGRGNNSVVVGQFCLVALNNARQNHIHILIFSY